MDGRLWTRLYREIRRVCKPVLRSRRAGRPRVYGTDEVLAVWAFAALIDWPISVTHDRLKAGATGWWMQRHSEPLHPLVRRRLRATLLAPLNLRGGKTDHWRHNL